MNGQLKTSIKISNKGALPSVKKEWVLTQTAFEQLLSCLAHDREEAAARYEELRAMLITFFEFRDSPDPSEEADEVINRVARRINEGQTIGASSIAAYFYAVARNVWRERIVKPQSNSIPLDDLPPGRELAESPLELTMRDGEQTKRERRLECLEHCLRGLSAAQHDLIKNYYQGEQATKIENRKELAGRLGIPLNALRIRASRLRDKLENCVNDCLKEAV